MNISQRLRTCAKHTGLDAVIELLQEAADEIDALQARAQVQGEPVCWEWRHLGSNQFAADFGQWSEWKRVEARNPIFTAEDELRTLRRYIADGYKYELRALYTTPQATPVCGAQNAESDPQAPLSLTAAPQQATPDDMKVYASIADRYFREAAQADVKDEQILEIAEPFGEFQYGDAQGHKRIDFARAILALRPEQSGLTGCNCRWDGDTQVQWCELHLAHKEAIHEWAERAKEAEKQLALRPERVPMTEDQVWHNDALMSANGTAGFKMDALMRIVRATEAHHFGITTQPKGGE